MQMSEERLLQAISDMLEEKLDKKLDEKLDEKLVHMVTKSDLEERLADMVTKEDLKSTMENVVTKEDLKSAMKNVVTNKALDRRLREVENNILAEVDRVQEKTNTHFDRIEERLDNLENTVSMIRIEVGTIELLTRNVADLNHRVTCLEAKVS